MLAAVNDSIQLDALTGQLSRFLCWHRARGTVGFSSPLTALWIGDEQEPPNLPPVSESVGISGLWTVYRFEEEEIRLPDLLAGSGGSDPGDSAASFVPAGDGSTGRFIPVLPHDLSFSDVLHELSEIAARPDVPGITYLLQHRETGRLLSSAEYGYPVRPLI